MLAERRAAALAALLLLLAGCGGSAAPNASASGSAKAAPDASGSLSRHVCPGSLPRAFRCSVCTMNQPALNPFLLLRGAMFFDIDRRYEILDDELKHLISVIGYRMARESSTDANARRGGSSAPR